MKILITEVSGFLFRFIVVALLLCGETFFIRFISSHSFDESFFETLALVSTFAFPFSFYALYCLWQIVELVCTECHDVYTFWQFERSLGKVINILKEGEKRVGAEPGQFILPFVANELKDIYGQ